MLAAYDDEYGMNNESANLIQGIVEILKWFGCNILGGIKYLVRVVQGKGYLPYFRLDFVIKEISSLFSL